MYVSVPTNQQNKYVMYAYVGSIRTNTAAHNGPTDSSAVTDLRHGLLLLARSSQRHHVCAGDRPRPLPTLPGQRERAENPVEEAAAWDCFGGGGSRGRGTVCAPGQPNSTQPAVTSAACTMYEYVQ